MKIKGQLNGTGNNRPKVDFEKKHEWELAILHRMALDREDYETCGAIQKEVDKRIESDTINHGLMDGFVYYNPKTKKLEGEPNYTGMNGLFKNYKGRK